MNTIKISLFLLMAAIISGCVVRTYQIEKPRVDMDVDGNRGVLFGSSDCVPATRRLGGTRTIRVIDFDLGVPEGEAEVEPVERVSRDRDVSLDYLIKEEKVVEKKVIQKERKIAEPKEEYQLYVVQKDDTLQKISDKFYGTTRRWMSIYKANEDILPDSDRITPGVTIKIPVSR